MQGGRALFGVAEGELVSNGAGVASGVGAADPNGQATPEGGPKFDLADFVFAPGLAWLSQVGFVALVELFGEFWFFGISLSQEVRHEDAHEDQ